MLPGSRPGIQHQVPDIWTPERATGLTFDLDISRSNLLTLSGSEITAATDAAGGVYSLAKSGTGPALDTANKIGGYNTLKTTVATGEKLFTSSGPAMGSGIDCTLYAVAQLYGSNQYPTFLVVGSPTGASQKAVEIGARGGTQWWAGCQDATLGAVGGTMDTNAHVFGLQYDHSTGKFDLRVDGILIAGPTAGTIVSSATFPTGFGIAPTFSGFNGNVRLARGLFRIVSLDSRALRQQHERYLAVKYGLTLSNLVAGVGDSITSGVGTSNPPTTSYLGQLSAQTALSGWTFSVFNDGHAGATAAGVISAMTSAAQASGARQTNIAIVMAGTNDIAQSVSTSTTITNLSTIITTLQNAGYRVLVATLFEWVNGSPFRWSTADQATINNWILANVAASRIIRWDLTPEMALVAGAYDGTNRQSGGANDGHPKDPGAAALARDAAAVVAVNR